MPAKKKITVSLDEDLVKRAHDAAYWGRFTVTEIVREALKVHLRKMERKYNKGESFNAALRPLPPGRPRGRNEPAE